MDIILLSYIKDNTYIKFYAFTFLLHFHKIDHMHFNVYRVNDYVFIIAFNTLTVWITDISMSG